MEKHTYICRTCGESFKSYNPNPTFCSKKCKGLFQQQYIDFEEAKKLYEAGKSQNEIAEHFKTTQKVIHNVFKRNNYKCRVAAKRNQFGKNNSSWKGDNATYAALHYRVVSQRGRPQKCDVCGTDKSTTIYDWACIGDYKKVDDYKRMCRSCHWKHDKIGNNFSNNKRVPNNQIKNVKRKK